VPTLDVRLGGATSGRCPHLGGAHIRCEAGRCPHLGGAHIRCGAGRCPHMGGAHIWEVPTSGRCPHLLFTFDVTVTAEPSLEIELLAQYDRTVHGWVLCLVRSFCAFLSPSHLSLYLSLHVSPFLSLSFVPISPSLRLSPCHLFLYLSR
jgi:hypothetical protein